MHFIRLNTNPTVAQGESLNIMESDVWLWKNIRYAFIHVLHFE